MNKKHKLCLGKKREKKYKHVGCIMRDLIIWMIFLVKSDYIEKS